MVAALSAELDAIRQNRWANQGVYPSKQGYREGLGALKAANPTKGGQKKQGGGKFWRDILSMYCIEAAWCASVLNCPGFSNAATVRAFRLASTVLIYRSLFGRSVRVLNRRSKNRNLTGLLQVPGRFISLPVAH